MQHLDWSIAAGLCAGRKGEADGLDWLRLPIPVPPKNVRVPFSELLRRPSAWFTLPWWYGFWPAPFFSPLSPGGRATGLGRGRCPRDSGNDSQRRPHLATTKRP